MKRDDRMKVRIVKCPRCLKKTLIAIVTNSTVSHSCSECDFKQIMLLSDCKNKKPE